MLQVPYYRYHIPFTYWPTRQLHDSLHNKYTSRLHLTPVPVQNYVSFPCLKKCPYNYTHNMI